MTLGMTATDGVAQNLGHPELVWTLRDAARYMATSQAQTDQHTAALLRAIASHVEQGWTAPGGGIAMHAKALAGAVLEGA